MYKYNLSNPQLAKEMCCSEVKLTLKKVRNHNHPTCWLQVEEKFTTGVNYVHCFLNLLTERAKSDSQLYPPLLITNFDNQGNQYADTLVVLCKQILQQIDSLKPEHKLWFIKKLTSDKIKLNVHALATYVPEASRIFGSNENAATTTDIKPERFNRALFKLIEQYCIELGSLVITVVNTDHIPHIELAFLAKLMQQIPLRLCIVTTFKDRELKLANIAKHKSNLEPFESHFLTANMKSIAKQSIKTLVREFFILEHACESELTSYIYDHYPITNTTLAYEVISNIVRYYRQHAPAIDEESGKITSINIQEINKLYLVPAEAIQADESVLSHEKDSYEESNVRLLCAILGPYIKLSVLQELYRFCFSTQFPSEVSFKRLGLKRDSDDEIRFKNIIIYEKNRNLAFKDSRFKKIKKKLLSGLEDCQPLKDHIDYLYEMRAVLKSVMHIHIQQALCSLLGLEIEAAKTLESSLQHSLELSDDESEKDDENTKSDGKVNQEYIKMLIHCYNELIDYYSSKIDMKMAFRCCSRISTYLASFHTKSYVFDVSDLDLAEMVKLKTVDNTKVPFGKLDETSYDALIELLSTMCLQYYFAEMYVHMRKCVVYGLQLLNKSNKYSAIITSSCALIFSRAAELQLSDDINAILSSNQRIDPIEKKKFVAYNAYRTAAKLQVDVVAESLIKSPEQDGQALAWSMLGAIGANFSMCYRDTWKFLVYSYHLGIAGDDKFRPLLAFGNGILCAFCAGVSNVVLENLCTNFLEACTEYKIELPKPIIQGFLNFCKVFRGEIIEVDSSVIEEGANRFFLNFTNFLILFIQEDYKACLKLAKAMHDLEFLGVHDNLRVGYNIRIDWLILRAISAIRVIDTAAEDEHDNLIRLIIAAMLTFDMYAQEFPENYDCRFTFLMTEIYRSRFSKRISGFETADLNITLNNYQTSLLSAKNAHNRFYEHIIRKASLTAQVELARDTENALRAVQPHLYPLPRQIVKNSNTKLTHGYNQLIHQLTQMTKADLVLLFIVISHRKPAVSHRSFATFEWLKELRNQNFQDYWDADTLKEVTKTRKMVQVNYPLPPERNHLQKMNIHGVLALPVIEKGVLRGILYIQGGSEMHLSEKEKQYLSDFPSKYCLAALNNEILLQYTITPDYFAHPRTMVLKSCSTSSSQSEHSSSSNSPTNSTGSGSVMSDKSTPKELAQRLNRKDSMASLLVRSTVIHQSAIRQAFVRDDCPEPTVFNTATTTIMAKDGH